jgi:hypothetical protein
MSGYESLGVRPATSTRRILKVALAMLLLTAFMIAGGIAMVTALGRLGDLATWTRGNVGQTFETVSSVVTALAIGGIMISWAFQAWQIQMAVNDPVLAVVWPHDGSSDPVTQQQYFYANLLIQHAWLQHTTGIATHAEMVSNLKHLFACSPEVKRQAARRVPNEEP